MDIRRHGLKVALVQLSVSSIDFFVPIRASQVQRTPMRTIEGLNTGNSARAAKWDWIYAGK